MVNAYIRTAAPEKANVTHIEGVALLMREQCCIQNLILILDVKLHPSWIGCRAHGMSLPDHLVTLLGVLFTRMCGSSLVLP